MDISADAQVASEIPEGFRQYLCSKCGEPQIIAIDDDSLGGLCTECRRAWRREKYQPCLNCAERYPELSPDSLCVICQNKKDTADGATAIPHEPIAELQNIYSATNNDGDKISLLGYKASDIKPKPLEWLWPNKIPKGKITLLAGKPDCGKSTVLCDLIARVTTGSDWPDGTKNTDGPLRVLLASSEDDPADTLVPRLMAAGADLGMIEILDSVTVQEAVKDQYGKLVGMKKQMKKALMLTLHIKLIKVMLRNTPGISLIALDPLTAYLGADANRDKDIRPVMEGMADACRGTAATIIGLIHHNKRSDVDSLQKILGASSVAGVARAAWGFGRDPEDKEKCYMALVKGNLAKKRTGMNYRIEEASIPSDDGEILAPRIQWEGEREEDANDMLNMEREKNKQGGEASVGKLEAAKLLLNMLLQEGPKRSVEVYRAAEQGNISDKTIRRALDTLGGKSIQLHGERGWWMALASAKEDRIPDSEAL